MTTATEPLPDWVTRLAPKNADEAWVAQRWALLTRHIVACVWGCRLTSAGIGMKAGGGASESEGSAASIA